MNITLKEFMDQAQHILSINKVKTNEELILDAWVAGPNEKYPEGTVIFECQNIHEMDSKHKRTHSLSVFPKTISTIQ